MDAHDEGHGSPPRFWGSRHAIGLVVIGGVAAYFLFTEHRAHIVGVLPYLLVLACPLMHIFMHGGHGGRRHHGQDPPGSSADGDERKPRAPS
ncbi:MAG: hypothetical protein IOMNBAOH_00537 [Rhodocyclaceae bacterium]|nr:hypothetical protein [Rhodocyclaceae bacterium]